MDQQPTPSGQESSKTGTCSECKNWIEAHPRQYEARCGYCRRIVATPHGSIASTVAATILGRGDFRTGADWYCPLFVKIGDHDRDIRASIAPVPETAPFESDPAA